MPRLPQNPEARYRAARVTLFRQVVQRENLQGVILAHHADDQAETVLQRLLRGSGPAGLTGMARRTALSGLVMLRPLLGVTRRQLRDVLRAAGQDWRDDASNLTDQYLRNRLRRLLDDLPQLGEDLRTMAEAMAELRHWTQAAAPELPESFELARLSGLPRILAEESARHWLLAQGAAAGELSPAVLDRFLAMAQDAATPPRQHFPGKLLVQRRQKMISVRRMPGG